MSSDVSVPRGWGAIGIELIAKSLISKSARVLANHSYQIAQATLNGDTPISVGLPATKEHSGHSPDLPRAPMLRIKQRERSFGKVALRTSRRKPNLLRTRR